MSAARLVRWADRRFTAHLDAMVALAPNVRTEEDLRALPWRVKLRLASRLVRASGCALILYPLCRLRPALWKECE